jgi:hybrid cluster-associated redox disulfide protein
MDDSNTLERKGSPGPVTRKTVIADVLDTRPLAGRVLREAFQLPCEECVVAERETIEEGARYYGLDPDAIVARLNQCPLAPEEPDASRDAVR